MARGVHLVGGIPGDSALEAMEAALRRVGPYLRTLSDGETGARSQWIQVNINNLRGHPDLEMVRDGTYTSYEDTPAWRVKDGHGLTADDLEARLVMADAFSASYPLFKKLRDQHGRPDLAFQVGIPLHLDYALYTVGENAFVPEVYEAYLEATARQVRSIQQASDGDVVFQLEMPAPLVSVARAGDDAQPDTAVSMARMALDLPARAADGTRFGVHLCLGDMNHKSQTRMRDARPVVLLANEVAKQWPDGRTLEFIHAPFAAAEEPPTLDPAFYEPLQGLDLPASVRFAAGFVHEHVSLDDSRALLALIESLVGREVDLAAACGLARRPDVTQAWDAMDKSTALVEA